MKAEDLRDILNNFAEKLSTIIKDDIENIEVDEEWSNIPFVLEHLEFLVDQTKGLSESLRDKGQADVEGQSQSSCK